MEIINVADQIIEINVTNDIVNVQVQNGAYPLPNNVYSVFGRVGNVVGQAGDYNTDLVGEGLLNKYYTDARARAAISENITGIDYSSASGIFSLASGYVIPTQAMLDAKVPYTGATGNVALGEYQLGAGQIAFDQTPTGAAGVGIMRWNDTDGTLDLGLKGGNVTLQLGQEMVKRVVNGSGINLTEAGYQVVKIIGAQGQRLQVALAQANNDLNSATTLGIVTENINNNQEGFITTSGEVREINTTGSLQGETWADGDILYLSPSVAGKITNIKPTAPNHMVVLGYVEYAHSQHGKIFVKIDNGYELEELHNVLAPSKNNNDVLTWDATGSVWVNKSIVSNLGYTPVTNARTISTTAPLTGGGDLSANRTLAITQAGVSTDGYLSTTDWNTFNNKQPLITAGTTAQYYRGDKTFQTLNTAAVPESTNLYYTQARFDSAFSAKSTTNLTEGTNLYFTNARAQAAISGTLPISVVSGVVSISQAGGASNGYLSSTDWNTFNNKQAALGGTGFVKSTAGVISYDTNTYLTTISGIAAGGELSGTYANPSLVNSAVTGKVLTGLNLTGGGTIADTDTILGAFGKVQNQISALVGGVMYKGTWNASTNTPTITSSVGTKGNYYIVTTPGTTNINGITDWKVGDWIIFNGSTWDKVDNTDAVSSVNGYTGAVSLVTSDVAESGNLYFTNARAIGSTLTGYTSGAGVVASTDTILQAIQKLNGNIGALVTGVSSVFGRTGAVTAQSGDYTTTQVTEGTNLYYTQARFDTAFSGKSTTNLAEGTNLYYTAARFNTAFAAKTTTDLTEGTNLYYTEARVSANTDVAANTAARHSAVTLGTANGLSLSTQQLSLGLASASANGALSSTDWSTFNAKQNALTFGNLTESTSSVLTITGGTGSVIGSGTTIQVKQASGSQSGFLSSTDWTTFNNKQNALTNPVTGTGTINYLPKFTGSTTIGNSAIQDDGSLITLGLNTTLTASQPDYTLKYTSASNYARMLFYENATYKGVIQFMGSSFVTTLRQNALEIINGTTGDIAMGSGDSRTFYIKNGGNVGINITNPGSNTLAVKGSTDGIIYAVGANNTYKAEMQVEGAGQFTGSLVAIPSAGSSYLGVPTSTIGLATSSTALVFATNGSEKMRIGTDGRVFIGVAGSSNGHKLEINAGSSSAIRVDVTSGYSAIAISPGGEFNIDRPGLGGGAFKFTSGGDLLVGKNVVLWTSPGLQTEANGTNLGITNPNSSNNIFLRKNDATGTMIQFWYNNSSVGSVSISTSSTSYNTSSDYRLKEDLKEINGLQKVSAIKVYDFQWKSDKTRMDGVLAHELAEVLPYAVYGEKDGEEMQGVDYSKIVPVLVKSIQELNAKVTALENK